MPASTGTVSVTPALKSTKFFNKIQHFNQFNSLIDHSYKFVTFKKMGEFKIFFESFYLVAFLIQFQLLKYTFFIQNLEADYRGLIFPF